MAYGFLMVASPSVNAAHLYNKAGNYYCNPDDLPNLEALQHSTDVQRQIGFLKAPIDVKALSDLRIVKETIARLNGRLP